MCSPHAPHHCLTVEDDEDEDDVPIAGLKCSRHEDTEETQPSNPFSDPAACKHNRQARDPPHTHPCTIFIPEQDAEAMEKYVDFIRSKQVPAKKRTNTEEPDHLEGLLCMPKSVLDGCEAGFTAADSRRKKASTQFFNDTALMALLCCHDVVLFIANMRSAGEKQHYMMVLVETLFQHLPPPYHVGLLYNIGCQTERSCMKWGFLNRYIKRIIFGISVFHVFGHQSAVIINVCILSIARSIMRRWKAAEEVLQKCGKPEIHLQAEWKAQVETQTKPLPYAVKELIQLCETRDGLKKQQHKYNTLIEDENTPLDEYTEVKTELESVRLRLQDLTAKIRDKQSALGVADRARLEKLLNDPFLTARMNALALKQCLRDRLRSRKFELDWLECSFCKQVNVDAHTAASVRSCEPAISKVARSYNTLCNTMEQLLKKGKAPRGAICPKLLKLKGIFDLDVDDMIWEDIGLEEGTPAALPPWLADEDVCAGIKALLERDRCLEEQVRLRHKCCSMRIWLSEEWHIVNLALSTGVCSHALQDHALIDELDDKSLAYHLRLRHSSLLRLCSQWQLSVHSLDFGDITSLPDWGPSAKDILNFHNMQKTALIKDISRTYTDNTRYNYQLHCEEQDEESEYSDLEYGEVDMILIDTINAVHLADTA
ncbi:hypothetical protein DXG01_007796 [Tephrocybe rancida]|nr:hypothetical protein DXG01_007796 [Tephrocybe rancida]